MAVKTITIEMKAYDALARARIHPRESFSEVIRRARWDAKQHTGRALLAFVEHRSTERMVLSESAIDALAAQDASDAQPGPKAKSRL